MSTPGKQLSEVNFVRWLVSLLNTQPTGQGLIVGAGDDCAIVCVGGHKLLLTTDCLIEGIHFQRQWLSAAKLGRRAFLVSASDLAAMGATPHSALLNLQVPADISLTYLKSLVRGFTWECQAHGGQLVGGNLSRGPVLEVTVAWLGLIRSKHVPRDRARVGHRLFVSGTVGGASGGLSLLKSGGGQKPASSLTRRKLINCWVTPPARFKLGAMLARRGLARAMIDLSDGLLQDLARVCSASNVGAIVDPAKLPLPPALSQQFAEKATRHALSGGEDYELLFSVPPRLVNQAIAAATAARCRITEIGRFVSGNSVRILGRSGRLQTPKGLWGFDHFRPG